MFGIKKREIKNNTKRIAKGTFVLSSMNEKMFTNIYQKMEKAKLENPCEYKIPEWFTIKFVEKEKNIYEFIGSFNDGNGYPLVYKDDFLKILEKYHVELEKIEENTYKIIRKTPQ